MLNSAFDILLVNCWHVLKTKAPEYTINSSVEYPNFSQKGVVQPVAVYNQVFWQCIIWNILGVTKSRVVNVCNSIIAIFYNKKNMWVRLSSEHYTTRYVDCRSISYANNIIRINFLW